MVGIGGVVCRKWLGYRGGLEKVVGVVGVNCIRVWELFGWFGESGWDCWGDFYGGAHREEYRLYNFPILQKQ